MGGSGKINEEIKHPHKGIELTKTVLNRDIRFTDLIKTGTPGLIDHQRCWFWERERTRYFIDESFRSKVDKIRNAARQHKKSIKSAKSPTERDELNTAWYTRKDDDRILEVLFPYFCDHWPQKAYLSIPRKIRKSFVDAIGVSGIDWFQHPFEDKLIHPNKTPRKNHNESYADIGYVQNDYVKDPPSESIPITIHVRTDWTQERFVEVMKEYSRDIIAAVQHEKEKFKEQGYPFIKKESKKPLKTYKSLLKKLGHYRLSECVGLDHYNITKTYPERKKDHKYFPYEEEAFKAAIKEVGNFLKSPPSTDK